jgi:antirestriction protein ArdC
MANRNEDVYTWVTERIITALENGVIPWRRPWLLAHAPMNLASGKAYNGINVFTLAIAGEKYTSRYWVTRKQCRDRGGSIRKGEKSSMIVFWKVGDRKDKETGEVIRDANGKPKKSFLLIYSNVWNVEQCDGLEYPKPENDRPTVDPIEACENIMASFTDCPPITHGGDSAYYSQKRDAIGMPPMQNFNGNAEYYSTLFHECVHSTGHESRLNRNLTGSFGTSDYAREELVAEMGAAMLCGVAGIECKTLDNSAAYIASWLKRLKNDNKLVVTAAKQAQAASEYMQGVKSNANNEPRDGEDESANAVAPETAAA